MVVGEYFPLPPFSPSRHAGLAEEIKGVGGGRRVRATVAGDSSKVVLVWGNILYPSFKGGYPGGPSGFYHHIPGSTASCLAATWWYRGVVTFSPPPGRYKDMLQKAFIESLFRILIKTFWIEALPMKMFWLERLL